MFTVFLYTIALFSNTNETFLLYISIVALWNDGSWENDWTFGQFM